MVSRETYIDNNNTEGGNPEWKVEGEKYCKKYQCLFQGNNRREG